MTVGEGKASSRARRRVPRSQAVSDVKAGNARVWSRASMASTSRGGEGSRGGVVDDIVHGQGEP